MELRLPGDKSISQRALILGALAEGESRVRGLLADGDPASTARALRDLGVEIPPLEEGPEVRIRGVGLQGLRAPREPLDLENSGTGARLLLGVLAGQPLEAVVTGDGSLRKRPMARVTDPLSTMGARFHFLEREGRLPVRVRGGELRSLSHRLPVASAQVKSALLLAGVVGGVPVSLIEPGHSRDHTERMLSAVGCGIQSREVRNGWEVSLVSSPPALDPLELDVPSDFSSAAFLVLLGLLLPTSEPLVLKDVGLNPTRTGMLGVLKDMGARLGVDNPRRLAGGEPVADLVVVPSELKGCQVGEDLIPSLIDEVPILAVGAARAQGVTRITGARELRVKETDRIRALVENLRAIGVEAEEMEDGLEIQGTDRPLVGTVQSFGDHRIAMAFGILGALPGNRIQVEDRDVVGVSFPGFWEVLDRISLSVQPPPSASGGPAPDEGEKEEGDAVAPRPPVITLDGPAGSGKSSTAREVARRMGFRHLDSGALYRALTVALLESGVPREAWDDLTVEELNRFHIRLEPAGSRFRVLLGDRVLEDELRTPEVTALVSPLSAIPAVREWLLEAQRRAGQGGGLVADGRDMGTVVFPGAEVKVFLTAALRERARRRFLEREGREPVDEETEDEARKIQERDERDSGRAVAPLRKPQDALELDTSDLSFEAQVQAILDYAKTLTEN